MITGKDNQKIKLIRKLLTPGGSKKSDCFVLEGERAVTDAIKAGADLPFVLVREDYTGALPSVLYDTVEASLFSALCETENAQGILAVARKLNYTIDRIKTGPFLYTDGVRDPGNLGTLIRSADAFGLTGVLLSPDTVSLYNPKTVRSTMSSLFHVPIVENVSHEMLFDLQKDGAVLTGGVLSPDTVPVGDADFNKNTVIIIGNEANGISMPLLSRLDQKVMIPMAGKAESLNAAVSGGIMMFMLATKLSENKAERNPL